MCGIIGYTGFQPALYIAVEALRKLEYRGYDSSGVAFIDNHTFTARKAAGKLENLEKKIQPELHKPVTCAIGHTRWATHGEPTENNAHPHMDNSKRLCIVHNGIIENYLELKEFLKPHGVQYSSETDTEVLVNFIAYHLEREGDIEKALQVALKEVTGAYALVISDINHPNKLWAVRQSGPMLLGVGQNEYFIASDAPAFIAWTKDVVFINEGELLCCEPTGYTLKHLADLSEISRDAVTLTWDTVSAQKDGYKHFMLKEIFEQPKVIGDCLRSRITDSKVALHELDHMPTPRRIHIAACGTSYYAALWGKDIIEELAGVAVTVELASEFAFRTPAFFDDEFMLCMSQSGETADTLTALLKAKKLNIPTVAICNVLGSSLSREADTTLYTYAGPEISVASTKAMTAQMVLLLLMAMYYAQKKGINAEQISKYIEGIEAMPKVLENQLPSIAERAEALSIEYYKEKHFFFLGRGYQYALALEGALKVKELSYIHAEGYSSAEMKHGPIALIDTEFPTFVIAANDHLFEKVRSNTEVVQARRGRTIVLSNKDAAINSTHSWQLPLTQVQPLQSFLILPALQLFAYHVATQLNLDVDQPRNLAKSVTVE